MLHTGGRPTSSTALGLSLCGLAWHQARRAVQLEDLPVLALVFSNGLCQLMVWRLHAVVHLLSWGGSASVTEPM